MAGPDSEYIPGYIILTMWPWMARSYGRDDQTASGRGLDMGLVAKATNMTAIEMTVTDLTVTQQLVETAAAHGDRNALIGHVASQAYTYADLASTIKRAAAGLAWRGLRPRDVVGVYVPDVASYVLACHAIGAAGGVPCPVSPELSIGAAAGQLADCGARMLLTAPPLAAAALAAADRSWVRQVISFGEAPATTPFGSLLGMGSLQPPAARPHDLALLPYRRTTAGALHPVGLTHLDLATQLAGLRGTADVTERDVVLAAPPVGDGRSYTALVDHALLSGATLAAVATADELAAAASEHGGTAAIVPLGVQVPAAEALRLFAVA